MGEQNWDHCVALGNALAASCGDRVLVLASSDLSHFYNYDRATELDGVFCDLLMTLEARGLYDAAHDGRCEACGAGPVVASLLATEQRPQRSCRLLARANSGDTTGDRASVVGYASAIVTTDA